ncbi:MAG: ATP-binding protein [Patescibacteria group bacterium]
MSFQTIFPAINNIAVFLIVGSGGIAIFIAAVAIRLRRRAEREAMLRKQAEEVAVRRTKELEQAAIAIENDRKRLNAILSSMGEGVIVFDADRRIVLMNQAAGILLRVAPAAGLGKYVEDVLPCFRGVQGAIERSAFFDRVIKKVDALTIHLADDYYCKNSIGKIFPVTMVLASVLADKGIGGAVVTFRDVTEEKNIDRAKSEFVALASHQLQTPLVTINAYLELLLAGDAGRLTKAAREQIAEAERAAKRMTYLVRALLDVSKIELGTFAGEFVPTALEPIVRRAILDLAPLIEKRGVTVRENYAATVPAVLADAEHLELAVQNIISNAVKYAADNGTVDVEISVDANGVLLRITDNGCGIPADEQRRVFSKLFRAENVRKQVTDGTGLGLYIAKAIVDQIGGRIWFESRENHGTTFFIALPAATGGGLSTKKRNSVLWPIGKEK